MTNAPRRSSQRQDLKRWESEGAALRSGRRSHDPNPAPLPQAEPELDSFNIRTESGVIEDLEGNVWPNLQSAREKALIDASDIILKGDQLSEDRRGWCFEMMDRANQHVWAAPFSEAPNRRN